MNQISFYLDGNIEIVIGVGLHKFPYHTHNSFMVGAVLEGCSEFNIYNKTSKLSKGDAYIVPSNTGIAINPVSDFSYITICLENELANAFRTHNIDEQCFAIHLIDMFALYKVSAPVKSMCTEKTVRYLNNHFQSKFSLDELARNSYVSKYHLIRTFKKEMEITPKQYHQQCKVRCIKNMVFENSQSDIAYALNFSTQSHMNSIFKKYMGITMGSYSLAIEYIGQ